VGHGGVARAARRREETSRGHIMGSMSDPFVTFLSAAFGAAVGLVGVVIAQRGARLAAHDDRVWAVRAGLYPEALTWMNAQETVVMTVPWEEVDLPTDFAAMVALRGRLEAFGSARVVAAFDLIELGFNGGADETLSAFQFLETAIRQDLLQTTPAVRQSWHSRLFGKH
jgi:hypothetical protein